MKDSKTIQSDTLAAITKEAMKEQAGGRAAFVDYHGHVDVLTVSIRQSPEDYKRVMFEAKAHNEVEAKALLTLLKGRC